MNFKELSDQEIADLQRAIRLEVSKRKRRMALAEQLDIILEEIERNGYTVYYGGTYITRDGIELVGG